MKIIQSHETASHKKSSHTARSRQRKEARTEPLTFVCVDGEGVTLPDGTHNYVLIGVGQDQISNPNGLSWDRIFDFLYSRFETGSIAYTGFFLGYDFTQIFRSMPEYQARRLLDTKERAKRKRRLGHGGSSLDSQEIYFPVDLDGWEFDILGSKRLKFRPQGESRWMYICDTGGFFQKSFLQVINPKEWQDPIVTEEEYAEIIRGKEERSSASLDSDMLRYNRLENEVLSRVLHELDTGFRQLGIHLSPKQWFGPGQAAQAWLDSHDAITSKELQELVPYDILKAAIASYYGGWFEIMAHGIIPGDCYEYDINSAYPFIISKLPCLRHGSWKSGIPDNGNMDTMPTLVYAKVQSASSQEVPANYNHYIGSAPHRDKLGNISRPLMTEGWYWLHEIHAAVEAKIIKTYSVSESFHYDPCNCAPPFREVQDIYDLRLSVGKKTPLGIACKLAPNSLYGKFAQSVGNPKYGNPIYASLITSWCRTMILQAIATHPRGKSDVLMVATDGIFFRTPHTKIQSSTILGGWDSASRRNLCLFKPGVYWDDSTRESILRGDSPVFKARGVSARYFAEHLASIDDMFHTMLSDKTIPGKWPEAEFKIGFSMVTSTQALAWNKWNLAGTVNQDVCVKQSSNPSAKRTAWYWDGDILRSKPPKNIPYEPSEPYSKRFGLEDPWSQESTEQFGITEEGTVSDIWKQVLFP